MSTVTFEDVRLKEADVRIELGFGQFVSPLPVMNDEGRVIGTATPSFEGGNLKLHLVLDPHNPEVFDLDVEPKRVNVLADLTVSDNVLVDGVVTLVSR